MGNCFSCGSSAAFKNVRVVHLNGCVEEFESPVTVSQVTGIDKPPKHFVCAPAEVLTVGLKPLGPHIQLEPGHFYFMLPYSTLQSNVSPEDFAMVAGKLATVARNHRSKPTAPRTSPLSSQQNGSSPLWSSPGRSRNRITRRVSAGGAAAYDVQKSRKSRTWRPLLDTIGEISFN